jgi:hypothetical protein
MIPIASGVRVWLATGHTDMRRYAECMIMLSPRGRMMHGRQLCRTRLRIIL